MSDAPAPAVINPIAHGTPRGYRAHLRRGEEACVDCRAAERDATTARRASEEGRRRTRRNDRARKRAWIALAALYPDVFAALQEEALVAIQHEERQQGSGAA